MSGQGQKAAFSLLGALVRQSDKTNVIAWTMAAKQSSGLTNYQQQAEVDRTLLPYKAFDNRPTKQMTEERSPTASVRRSHPLDSFSTAFKRWVGKSPGVYQINGNG